MRATHTTARLKLPRARWIDLSPPVSAALVTFALIAIAALVGRIQSSTPAAAVQATPGLIIVYATSAPAPTPQAQQAAYVPQAPVVRYVVGFDSPNGRALGAIVAPEASEIVARFGDEWLETTHDGGPIWVRASELGMNIGDVAPAAPQLQPQIVYQVVNQPAAAPEPAAPTPAQEEAPPLDVRTLNIQQHYANERMQQELPTIEPRPLPYVARENGPSRIDYENAQQTWRQEHCAGSVCVP